jgi:hypothetical protein
MPIESPNPEPVLDDAAIVPAAYCRRCDYALLGLPGGTCPECGTTFDGTDPRTYRSRPGGWRRVFGRWARRVAVVAMCVALLVACGVAWVWRGWHAEQPVVRQLAGLGVQVRFKPIARRPFGFLAGERYDGIGRRVDFVSFAYRTSPAEIESLDLTPLRQLKTVWFDQVPVTPRTVAMLGELKSLEVLIMDWAPVDDAGLAKLSGLTNLEFLDVKGSKITDAGMPYLKKLTRLRRLDLEATAITDAGLEHLAGLKSLELLGLGRVGGDGSGRITPAGVDRLQRALPNVRIFAY